jgi:DedD protein
MLQAVPTDAGTTTRVRVGPYASKEEAESALAKLDKIGLHGKLLPL